jgi:hypothetical protein
MARQIQHLNQVYTTLDGAITDAATTVTVLDGTVFPSEGDFNIRIGDEILLVTGRATHDLTVVRGQEGSTAVAQSDGDYVLPLATGESFTKWAEDQVVNFSRDRIPERMQGASGVVLTSSDFSWSNQGSSTVNDHDGGMSITAAGNTGFSFRGLVKTEPSTPYTITAHIQLGAAGGDGTTSASMLVGAGWRDSATNKISAVVIRQGDLVSNWNLSSSTAFDSIEGTSYNFEHRQGAWVKFSHIGNVLTTLVSYDGINFLEISSETIGASAFLTPDQVGFFVHNGISGQARPGTLLAWYEE